mgnify:CR=1 FL=1
MILPSPLTWVKKSFAILKSNLTPNQIALGVVFGIFAGLPPPGLHIVVPATLAILVRCSFRAFLVSFGLFELLSLGVAPGAYAVGRWFLDPARGLDGVWRFVFHLPVVAPMGYERYLLFGSVVVSVLISVPVFLFVRLLVVRYRTELVEWVSGWRLSRWLAGRRGVGVLRRAFAGGEAKYRTRRSPRGALRFLRREGLVLLPAAYALAYLLAAVVVPFFAGELTTSTASWVVGSEVSVEGSSFSLFTGRLHLSDVSVQDPDTPEEDLVVIPAVAVDAGMIPLLAKRVVFDEVVIEDAKLHVVRERDGTLNIDNVGSGWNAEGYMEWAVEHARSVDWLGLLRQFLRYLSEVRPLASRDDPYAPFRGGRSFADFRPPFAVKRLEIGRVQVSLEDRLEKEGPLPDLTLLEVELSNLAFPASLRERPISIHLRGQFAGDPESGFALAARFEEGDVPISTFSISMTRIDLARIARFYRTTLPVEIRSAKATAEATLRCADRQAEGSVSLLIEDLEIASYPDRPLFGLPSDTSDRVIVGLNRYAQELPIVMGFPIGGSAAAPTWEWEAAVLEIARDGLLMSGRRHLASTAESLNARIEALGLPEAPLDADYEALRAETAQRATEMIGASTGGVVESLLGRTPDVQTPAEEAAGSAPGVRDLLERLLRSRDED